MIDIRGTIREFFARNATAVPLLTLGAATVMCVGLTGSRVLYTGSHGYLFLLWNLFLAWIPFLVSLVIRRSEENARRPRFRLLLLGVIWLLFYPNAPYILTDFVHLRPRGGSPFWFDMILIASFAWTGLLLGFASLYLMQRLVEKYYGWWKGWAFVVVVSFLSSFGIYLGRFERWNSWDIARDPRGILRDIWPMLVDPLGHPQPMAITLVLASFLLVGYFTLSAILHLKQLPRE
jgi:uncharacterized membrane protein